MATRILTVCIVFLCTFPLFAQPAYDDCSGLINLGEIPICPILDTFNNVNATPSIISTDPDVNIPSCFNGGTPDADVWLAFTVPADGSLVDIEILLDAVDGPNGGIMQPQLALYRGECLLEELQELECISALLGENSLALEVFGLTPGLQYFLRIDDWSANATPNWGDFELCIKEPNIISIMGTDLASSQCSGTLLDSGGADGPYSNSENNTFTICPSEATNCIDLEFVSFDIEQGFDDLRIYDGPDINSPLVAELTGTTTFPLQVGNNCITLQFLSDGSVTNPGFEINWSCSAMACETTQIPCLDNTIVNNLPFTSSESTCGAGNDINNTPCDTSDPIVGGEDVVYTYQSFAEACIDISIANANVNTGLSIYTDCPENTGANCLAYTQNPIGDALSITNLTINAFQTIYIVVSNGDGCTDFDIAIEQVECLTLAASRSSCDDALILNICNDLPSYFSISQQENLNPDYFQTGINDGCWSGVGASHYSWLFFQAQVDGEFALLMENSGAGEATNLNIQVWGPIADYEGLCDFMANNQPARSTGALNTTTNITGLTNTHPITGAAITDECEDVAGDGFISALPVEMGQFYLILINDFDGNITNGGMALDFSETTPGVLDGLPEDTDLVGQDYTIIGDASYYTQAFDFSCIQLTGAVNTQLSCVWAENQIDFFEPFSNTIAIYLGDNDGGADGICMVYQQSPEGDNACGISGGGIGAQGILNSFIIEFDTWQNADFGDPFQDHIAININGDMTNPIAGPVALGNIEDGVEHAVTFNWDPATNAYELLFDGVQILAGNYDIVQNCFQGISTAYCGFTASTGGANNLQYACTGDNKYPTASRDTVALTICEGETAFLEGMEQTEEGFYTDVYLASTGCDSTIVTELMVTQGAANSTTASICEGETIFLEGAQQSEAGVYTDMFTTANGCDSIVETTLSVFPAFSTTNAITICTGESIFVGGQEQTTTGTYTDNFTTIGGCDSLVITDLTVIEAEAIIENPIELDCTLETDCVTLDASSSTNDNTISYSWTASNGGEIIGDNQTSMPTVCGAGTYTLEVTNTVDNTVCTSVASVELIYNSDIICGTYKVPSAFSPNNDDLNDFFELAIEGTSYQAASLKVYNRWGQVVFEGLAANAKWDGTFQNKPAPTDVYVYIFEVLNADTGEIIMEQGDVTLLR